jgi:VacB/RNase II family 3'-5' exoribonuclease
LIRLLAFFYDWRMFDYQHKVNLASFAEQAMVEEGFVPVPPAAVLREVENLTDGLTDKIDSTVRDLRGLLWSSIDNETSLDLDQIEVAEKLENNSIRVLVAIADVDSFVPRGSAIDEFAAQNTTSVYTGVHTFPMLPDALSENLTSLLQDKERLAVVTDFTVAADGSAKLNDIYRAIVCNRAKMDYETVGAFLDGKGKLAIEIEGLPEQIRLQDAAADRLRAVRERAGALEFGTIEASAIQGRNGELTLAVQQKNQARYLIENFMIAANVLMAQFLESKQLPALERVVKKPERWQRIVEIAASYKWKLPDEPNSKALADFLAARRRADAVHFPDLSLSIVKLIGAGDYTVVAPGDANENGHFGLAVNDYTHSTAPNRRYADLVTQRLVKASIKERSAPYSIGELEQIAARCNERQTAARKVERRMRKTIAAEVLSRRVGEIFDAIITGVSPKGTFARLLNPPAEGKIVENESNVDVGDHVRVRLIKTDAQHGFVDFACI